MARKAILALSAASLLSACVSYPSLVAVEAPTAAPNSSSPDVDSALRRASRLQSEYSSGYIESAAIRDYSQLPIIFAAAAAAWILLDDGANAARDVGRIGIGAGAYSAARGQVFASDLPEVYIAGHAALTCVMSHGTYFSGAQAQRRHDTLVAALTALDGAIVDTTAVVAMQPSEGSAPELELLRTTKAAAEQAISQARLAATSARTEEMAYQGAGAVFWLAVSSISSRVASRGRQRPTVDYQALVEGFSPAQEAAPVAESSGTRPASEIIRELITVTGALVNATGRLRGVTPNYADRIERVSACPSQVG